MKSFLHRSLCRYLFDERGKGNRVFSKVEKRDAEFRGIGRALYTLLLLPLLLGACGENAPATKAAPSTSLQMPATTLPHPRYAITIQHDVAYGPLPAEKLDLCLPEKAAGARPGVILVHGGAWTGGDKTTLGGPCRLLAQQGFVAATVNYRLATKSVTSTRWPTQLVDVQLAVRWLRFQAPKLNLDPQRIGAWGSSAGGHLVIFLGSLKTIRSGDQAQLLASESPAISWVVDEFGPIDLTANKEAALNSNLLILFGASYQQNPAAYRDASPLFSINSQSAPTLIIQGTQDGLVPPAQSIELQQTLQKNHVPVQYISYNAGHGFHGLTKGQQRAIVAQEVNYLIGLEHP